jgi:hypothetical protein
MIGPSVGGSGSDSGGGEGCCGTKLTTSPAMRVTIAEPGWKVGTASLMPTLGTGVALQPHWPHALWMKDLAVASGWMLSSGKAGRGMLDRTAMKECAGGLLIIGVCREVKRVTDVGKMQ